MGCHSGQGHLPKNLGINYLVNLLQPWAAPVNEGSHWHKLRLFRLLFSEEKV